MWVEVSRNYAVSRYFKVRGRVGEQMGGRDRESERGVGVCEEARGNIKGQGGRQYE